MTLAVGVSPAFGKTTCYQSPWLAHHVCDRQVISKIPYTNLKQAIVAYLDKRKQEGALVDSGIYFRDLEDGPHFGVNEYTDFAAASLFKLPVVIQYLSLAEQDPGILQDKLVVPEGMEALYSLYPPAQRLVAGETHTIEDLLGRTIAYSDNLAFVMLSEHMVASYGNESMIQDAYRQLGLVAEVASTDTVISVVRYSSMFKLIYNAAFLNPAMSEKLVQMMLASTYEDGLVRGLPPSVKVAHKMGVFVYEKNTQLHDCGIVYYPDNPYVLCVMTRGPSEAELAKTIAEVSRMVYEEVDARRGRVP